MLATIRPDSWNYALFLHVLGASVLVGALVTAVGMQALGWARDAGGGALMLARLSFRTLLIVAIPAWIAMRIGAQLILSKEHLDVDNPPSWVDIGFITAEPGGVLLLIAVVLAGFGARRLAKNQGSDILVRSATVLTVVVLAAYLVALWAMTAKPG